jgi:hypothetical protein
MIQKSLRLIFASLVIIGGIAVTAFAQEGDNHKPKNINDRQQNQKERIKDGVQDGDINRREFGRLVHEQSQIRRQERRFKSDGEFTRGERARVQHNLNQASRHIRRAKRN